MAEELPPYQVWNIRVTFDADRGGDAMGRQQIVLTFDELVAGTPEHEAVMWLWRKAAADALAKRRAEGIRLDIG
jgi:hypothetical protein